MDENGLENVFFYGLEDGFEDGQKSILIFEVLKSEEDGLEEGGLKW